MRRGFTLIELLAVIVILAIISLIATPIVLGLIEDARKSSKVRSAELYIDGVENAIMSESLNRDGNFKPSICNIIDGNLLCNGENEIVEVEVDGEKPISGKIALVEGIIRDVLLNYQAEAIVTNKTGEYEYAYKESNSIEAPDLYKGTLTPVIYDGNNWIIADVSEKWYDYNNQEWANAVILNRDSTKKVGDKLVVDGNNPDILGMYVWIPRYEYKIEGTYGKNGTSKTNPGEIEVNFILASQQEPTSEYKIHSAFKFGDSILNGIWVGKFEISHTTKTASSIGCVDEKCSEGNNLRVLPNKVSLRYNSISSFFYGIRSMSQENNVFGIDSGITNTHMLKNSEWGAVSYLSQSKYGKYGNSNYTGTDKEVYVNNSSGFYTGRSGGSTNPSSTAQGTYKYNEEKNGTGASTTGNIYGIYDMSGGAWEYTMGVFANSNEELWSGRSITENSGFKGKVGTSGTYIEGLEWPEEKYYEVYKANNGTSISSSTACNGEVCYGHALSETSNWYSDTPNFVSSDSPWPTLGGAFGSKTSAGMFRSGGNTGGALDRQTTHIVLTLSNDAK